MNRRLLIIDCFALLLAALTGLPTTRVALADDDEIVASIPALNADVREMNVDFDSWVFPGAETAQTGRDRLLTRVGLQLGEVARVCQLNKDQEEKLRVAARGDTERFLAEVETVRRKFMAKKNDREAMNELWQFVHPL